MLKGTLSSRMMLILPFHTMRSMLRGESGARIVRVSLEGNAGRVTTTDPHVLEVLQRHLRGARADRAIDVSDTYLLCICFANGTRAKCTAYLSGDRTELAIAWFSDLLSCGDPDYFKVDIATDTTLKEFIRPLPKTVNYGVPH
jgi:hypothetical protein